MSKIKWTSKEPKKNGYYRIKSGDDFYDIACFSGGRWHLFGDNKKHEKLPDGYKRSTRTLEGGN